jgi:uncharacterized protein (DUF2267 family)
MPTHFEEYSQKGMEFLKHVAEQMQTPEDTAYADRLTTAVFATLRDLITPEESLHLISSLPMYLKAHYVNGWKIHKDKPRVKTREEFFELVREKYPRTSGRPLGDYQSLRKDVRAVFSVMRNYINEGEFRHLQVQLPQPIADLWDTDHTEQEVVQEQR